MKRLKMKTKRRKEKLTLDFVVVLYICLEFLLTPFMFISGYVCKHGKCLLLLEYHWL